MTAEGDEEDFGTEHVLGDTHGSEELRAELGGVGVGRGRADDKRDVNDLSALGEGGDGGCWSGKDGFDFRNESCSRFVYPSAGREGSVGVEGGDGNDAGKAEEEGGAGVVGDGLVNKGVEEGSR